MAGEQRDWDLHLGCLAGAYRATPNESTKMTPNLLTMGRELRLPGELIFGSTNGYDGEHITTYGDYVEILRARMQHAHEMARKYKSATAKRSKELYDSKVAFHRYSVGDVVWCLIGISPKLEVGFEGPFVVIKKLSELDYISQLDRDGVEKSVHHKNLKPYEGDNAPRWVEKVRKQLLRRRANCTK